MDCVFFVMIVLNNIFFVYVTRDGLGCLEWVLLSFDLLGIYNVSGIIKRMYITNMELMEI